MVFRDSLDETYEYRVSEVFVVEPNAHCLVDHVYGRAMVALQTCTYPTFEDRLLVRAGRR